MRNAVILLGWFSQNIIQCSTKLRENSRTVWLAFFFFLGCMTEQWILPLHMSVEVAHSEGNAGWAWCFRRKVSSRFSCSWWKAQYYYYYFLSHIFFLSLSLEARWPISRFISFLWKNSRWSCLKPCSEKSLCIYQRCFWFKMERSESSNLASQVRLAIQQSPVFCPQTAG